MFCKWCCKEARKSREELDESDLLGQTVTVDWAFVKGQPCNLQAHYL